MQPAKPVTRDEAAIGERDQAALHKGGTDSQMRFLRAEFARSRSTEYNPQILDTGATC
jgi:hypothetical protein